MTDDELAYQWGCDSAALARLIRDRPRDPLSGTVWETQAYVHARAAAHYGNRALGEPPLIIEFEVESKRRFSKARDLLASARPPGW